MAFPISPILLLDGYKVELGGLGFFVMHGIFSRGRSLKGIDAIYSTDSFPGGK